VVKARELHPIHLDSDLSLEDWVERFVREAHLGSAEKLKKAVELIEDLESKDHTPKDWAAPDAYRFGLEMADILSTMPVDEDTLVAALLYDQFGLGAFICVTFATSLVRRSRS